MRIVELHAHHQDIIIVIGREPASVVPAWEMEKPSTSLWMKKQFFGEKKKHFRISTMTMEGGSKKTESERKTIELIMIIVLDMKMSSQSDGSPEEREKAEKKFE